MQDLKNQSDDQLYSKGLEHFGSSDFPSGIQCFISAAKNNHIPSIKELGVCFLHGISVKQNLQKALAYLKKSKQHPESQFELAKLFFFGHGVERNLALSQKLLILSVKGNYLPAVNLMAMCYQMSGETQKSSQLFNYSLNKNDVFSKHLLQVNLLQESEASIDFINDFTWPSLDTIHPTNDINSSPKIFEINNILSEVECEYIKYISSPYMRESMTIDPDTGKFLRDKIRTSYSAAIDWLTEDPIINLIMQKCCLQFDVDANQSEVLHVLHYSVGEEYKPHYDFLGGIDGQANFTPDQQRIKTICLYLNDVDKGGDTTFTKLKKSIKPQKGNAVFFENINTETKVPYIESLHAGEPILKGEKWLATLWIREANTNRGISYEPS